MKAANLLKAEIKCEGVTYAGLVERLAKLGVDVKEVNVRNELSRGKLMAAFSSMSIRYWIAATLIGLTAVAANPQYSWAQEEDEPAQERITVPQPAFGLIEQTQEPDQLTNPCEPGDDNRRSDLCAQWKAADAADKSANWAEPMFRLGMVGAGIGVFTLIAAVGAAIFAKSAANATWKTVEVTRELGRRQLRAYVQVGDVQITNFVVGKEPVLSCTAKNYGQTPAFQFQQITRWELCDDPEVFSVSFDDGKWAGPRLDLPAGGESTQRTILKVLPQDNYDEIISGGRFLMFVGIIRYRDVFRIRRRTIFRQYLHPSRLDEGGNARLTICRKNNRSS